MWHFIPHSTRSSLFRASESAMHVFLIFLTFVSAIAYAASNVAPPQPADVTQPIHRLKQMTRSLREPVARAKYPEHFFDKRQEPSGEPDPRSPCNEFRARRRELETAYEHVSNPREGCRVSEGQRPIHLVSHPSSVHSQKSLAEAKQKWISVRMERSTSISTLPTP